MSPQQKNHLRTLSVLSVLTVTGLFWAEHTGRDEASAKGILGDADVTSVVGLRFTTPSRHVELVKDPHGWRKVGAGGGRADSELVSQTIGEIASIAAEPIHGMSPEDVSIGSVRLEVELDNRDPIVLLFGRPSPVGPGQYVVLEGVIHLTNEPLPIALVRPGAELRSYRPVFTARSQIGGVDISGKPIPENRLQELIENLLDVRIEAFEHQLPPSSPVTEIVLKGFQNEPIQTINLATGNPWLIEANEQWYPIGDGLESWARANSGWFRLSQDVISTD